mmetsp:Transcript_9379/g.19373  ORF Transcript_9379/g.19373 Transcript_9379/m.19373 type:complete len:210 (-) Transcript_9379:256-885(-)|eukprot:CAMPEP_0118928522 /NCGR_PEP_ID=MMETSP1169-20130426/5743_1 /TAXON_ID=36882 /ORGANISM="Pyramimonas obovata, Strain CCMP722" /LENGTH=209 /DNA_ID=CAMNT_0006870507 /DNA_START=157 /DNA_END=786 /DNA_ORIENTATION=-
MASGGPQEMLVTQASLSLGESVLQEVQTALAQERAALLQAERSVTELTKTLCDSRAVNKDGALKVEQQIEKQTQNLHTRFLEKQEATKQRLKQKKKLQQLAETAELDLEDVFGLPEVEDKLKDALRTQSQLRRALQKQHTENTETDSRIKEQQQIITARQLAVRQKELALEGHRALEEFRRQQEQGIRLPTQRMFYVERAPWYERLGIF